MTLILTAVLCAAVLLLLKPPLHAASRLRAATAGTPKVPGPPAPGFPKNRRLPWGGPAAGGDATQGQGLTLVVQQLAALLKGGRTPGRLWDELWRVHAVQAVNGHGIQEGYPCAPVLSEGSTAVLASARAAAATGAPVSDAIRRAVSMALPARYREARTWSELAACFDIAQASGCPLADVLTRFAAQLEAEDDADAARQTALAGPKATVRLLSWLPVLGLGLGAALGVDPLATLLGTPLGLAALLAGAALTAVGRIWSSRLVSAAARTGVA